MFGTFRCGREQVLGDGGPREGHEDVALRMPVRVRPAPPGLERKHAMTRLKMSKLSGVFPSVQEMEKYIKWCVEKYNDLSPEDKKRLRDAIEKAIKKLMKKDEE